MPSIRALLFLLVSGLGLVAPLRGQSASEVLESRLRRTPTVRLGADGARVTGRLIALGGGGASLETALGPRVVPLASIDSIWIRGRATKTGLLIGAGAGAVVAAVFLGTVVPAVCETDCEHAGRDAALAGFAIGAVGGGLLGAAVGTAFPKWRRRYP